MDRYVDDQFYIVIANNKKMFIQTFIFPFSLIDFTAI